MKRIFQCLLAAVEIVSLLSIATINGVDCLAPSGGARTVLDNNHQGRRNFLNSFGGRGAVVGMSTILVPVFPAAAVAKDSPTAQTPMDKILDAQETLDKLLQNWQRATVDCTFADVPRELLEAKNKELLLEKASTFALFDKSVSVETCKTTNRIVRDYLGVTGKGPLVGLDKQLRKALELIDPDDLEDYVSETEAFAQAMAKASSLSYAAGVADFDSVNNFNKEDQVTNSNSNLEQSRLAIKEAKSSLDKIVGFLRKGQS